MKAYKVWVNILNHAFQSRSSLLIVLYFNFIITYIIYLGYCRRFSLIYFPTRPKLLKIRLPPPQNLHMDYHLLNFLSEVIFIMLLIILIVVVWYIIFYIWQLLPSIFYHYSIILLNKDPALLLLTEWHSKSEHGGQLENLRLKSY